MSSRLADWLSCPEDVRPARQVVQLLWKYPGNVSSLVAHEAAQCVAFRAAATTVMYGPKLEHEAPSGWTTRLLGDKPPSFADAQDGQPQEFDPSAAVRPEAFIKALVWLLEPSKGITSPIQPAAASGLAMLLRDAGDAVAGPALDTGACRLLVKALGDSTPVTFSTRTNTWTASLREEAVEALHGLVALQTPEGERAQQAMVDMKAIKQMVSLLGERKGSQLPSPTLTSIRGCQLMHHLLERNGNLQVQVAHQAVEVGAVVPLAVAAGTLGCASTLGTLSLLLEQVPEARAQLTHEPAAIDALARQLSIGRGSAEREAAVCLLRYFVKEDPQQADTALSSGNWRGVYKHKSADKKISPAEWSVWWKQTRLDVGLDFVDAPCETPVNRQ
eukprot:jgi/Botrbrau1/8999/Bobra.0148s0102.1